MPPSLALYSPTIVTAVPLVITHATLYSEPGPVLPLSDSTVHLTMYCLNAVCSFFAVSPTIDAPFLLVQLRILASVNLPFI